MIDVAPQPEGVDWSTKSDLVVEARPLMEAITGDSFFVREARMGIVLWEAVPMEHRELRAAQVLELFLVEAALALEAVKLEDLAEVTGAPMETLERFAVRLSFAGALVKEPLGHYRVRREEAERIVEERKVPEITKRRTDLVFLPQADAVMAFDNLKIVRALKRVAAPAQAPVGAQTSPVRAFLSGRAEAGRIHGLEPGFVRIAAWPTEPVWEETCPCFFVRGRLPRTRSATAALTVHGRTRKGKAVAEPLEIPVASGLVDRWYELDRGLFRLEVRRRAGAVLFGDERMLIDASLRSDGVWYVPLSAELAQIVARVGWLVARWPVTISDGIAKVEAVVAFEPDDNESRLLFVLDYLASSLERARTAPAPSELEARWAQAEVTFDAHRPFDRKTLIARLWERGAHGAVHALREEEDFRDT